MDRGEKHDPTETLITAQALNGGLDRPARNKRTVLLQERLLDGRSKLPSSSSFGYPVQRKLQGRALIMLSYAQNYEDVRLARCFPNDYIGTYVDVGAADPIGDNATYHFYQRGWCGLNIEPIPERHAELKWSRPRDVSVNVAAGARDEVRRFYRTRGKGGLSTIVEEIGNRYANDSDVVWALDVPVRRLSALLDEYGVTTIDILKIDVEGAEGEVLAGLDLPCHAPAVAVIEATHPQTRECVRGDWEAKLFEGGLDFAYYDGLNAYYVRRDRRSLGNILAAPIDKASVTRAASWGNALTSPGHPVHKFGVVFGKRMLRSAAAGSVDLVAAVTRDMNPGDLTDRPSRYFVPIAYGLVLARSATPVELDRETGPEGEKSGLALVQRLLESDEFRGLLSLASV